MDWFSIIYFIALPIAFCYHAGAIMHAVVGDVKDADAEDFFFASMFGGLTMWAWPLTLVGRLLYIAARKAGITGLSSLFFPAPKYIESRDEKRERTAHEQRELHEAQMRMERVRTLQARERTNQLEAEAGIPLTVWNEDR